MSSNETIISLLILDDGQRRNSGLIHMNKINDALRQTQL